MSVDTITTETWQSIFGEQLASMNELSAKMTAQQFEAVVEEALEIAFMGDYDEERGFKDYEITQALNEAIVSFIRV